MKETKLGAWLIFQPASACAAIFVILAAHKNLHQNMFTILLPLHIITISWCIANFY